MSKRVIVGLDDIFRRCVVANDTGCWLWDRGLDTNGYGNVTVGGRSRRAHRLAWEYACGPIPPGMFVCHRCDVHCAPGDRTYRRCVNPDHLWLGTHQDNMRDRNEKGRTARGDAVRVTGDRHNSRTKPWTVPRGERHGNARLTNAQVREARARYRAGGVLQRELAAEYGVPTSTMREILAGRRYRSVTEAA